MSAPLPLLLISCLSPDRKDKRLEHDLTAGLRSWKGNIGELTDLIIQWLLPQQEGRVYALQPCNGVVKCCPVLQVYELNNAVANAQKAVAAGPGLPCRDEHELCVTWASRGECDKNPTYMAVSCRAACGRCKKAGGAPKKQSPAEKTPLNNQGVGDAAHAR